MDAYPIVEEVSALLNRPAEDLDASVTIAERAALLATVSDLNTRSAAGDPAAFYGQQLLLSRIYALSTQLPDRPTAEGSTFVHEVLRLLERATAAAEDAALEPGVLDAAPTEPSAYLSWLKKCARAHRVYKHPYYREFIRHHAVAEDLRDYVIQESVVDGRFDDLLATMQVGTSGDAKMEIAENFWDEMGNGHPSQVHTHLFNQIFQVFDIPAQEMERSLTANALLSGNLAVLLCRYRNLYPEAVGFLGMTEWLAPERFVNVVHAWERLGLPDAGIAYHKLHIAVDARHAAGWFHNVVVPAATSERMRRAIARGTLWRLNSSARYLDERMPDLSTYRPI
ncbi:iron-containing redox enzyme family protein [Streptomyces sp. NBC_01317]|uniref:iron-containing redox enzyme family protein n=1 Tax=Streptomyces sp. NBC_01317 TaxID=2903822 RepID=UPI002E13E4D0|nr:iron-containing redox enzyme family protein [Streptomyces sp. NBC_01317]